MAEKINGPNAEEEDISCIGNYGSFARCNSCTHSKECRDITVTSTPFKVFMKSKDFAA